MNDLNQNIKLNNTMKIIYFKLRKYYKIDQTILKLDHNYLIGITPDI